MDTCRITLNSQLTLEQRELYQDPKVIQRLLRDSKSTAVVGLSTDKTKASNMVASYLQDVGYRVIPVHPKAEEILGETAYPTVSAIPFPVDIVDIFRPADEVSDIVLQAAANGAKAVWMQLRIVNIPAAEEALRLGMEAVVDKCIKMEHGRYGGMLHLAGMNTEIISARRLAK
ncbi:MAG: CoA-binding protein [Chthonomonas sp.]|nr:CoA-binding protein [Chthonomonas sp.]